MLTAWRCPQTVNRFEAVARASRGTRPRCCERVAGKQDDPDRRRTLSVRPSPGAM